MKDQKKIVVDSDEDGYALPETDFFNTPDQYDDYSDIDETSSFEERYRRTTQWGAKFVIKTPIPKMIEHLYFGNTLKSDWIEPDVYATEPLEEFGIWEMPDYLTDHQVDAERDELFVSLTIKLNNTDH